MYEQHTFNALEILHHLAFSRKLLNYFLMFVVKLAWRNELVFWQLGIHLDDNIRLQILCY